MLQKNKRNVTQKSYRLKTIKYDIWQLMAKRETRKSVRV